MPVAIIKCQFAPRYASQFVVVATHAFRQKNVASFTTITCYQRQQTAEERDAFVTERYRPRQSRLIFDKRYDFAATLQVALYMIFAAAARNMRQDTLALICGIYRA